MERSHALAVRVCIALSITGALVLLVAWWNPFPLSLLPELHRTMLYPLGLVMLPPPPSAGG